MGQVYSQLTLEERRKIERWRHARVSVDEIAKTLNRHRSTIFRELRRNHFSDQELPDVKGYFAVAAQTFSSNRRTQQQKLIKFPDLCRRIVERIKSGWTPEQIANQMIFENVQPRVCQETIYRYIYSQDGMSKNCGGICPCTENHACPAEHEKSYLQNSIEMSAFYSVPPEAVAYRSQFVIGFA